MHERAAWGRFNLSTYNAQARARTPSPGECCVAVAHGYDARSLRETNPRPWLAYEVIPVKEALLRRYEFDAFMVPYVLVGIQRQPRLSNASLKLLSAEPMVKVLFCDVDNPDHSEWTEADLARLPELYRTTPILRTTAIHDTKRGYRIVQPLEVAVPVSQIEAITYAWYDQLEDQGIRPDRNCVDWPHHFRAPRVIRDGARFEPRHMLVDQMAAATIDVVAPPERRQTRIRCGTSSNKSRSGLARAKQRCTGEPSFWKHIEILRRTGITAFNTFHEVQRDLVHARWLEGASQAECEQWMIDYVSRFEHQSGTLKEDPTKAMAEITRTIRSRYAAGPCLQPVRRRRGISRRVWLRLFDATKALPDRNRYAQLQFLFDLVLEFKTRRQLELDLPRERIKNFLGAHGGTYQERLQFALDLGVVVDCGGRPRPGKCRRFRICVDLDESDDYPTVDHALADSDMSFLSRHMRERKVLANVTNGRDVSLEKRSGRRRSKCCSGSSERRSSPSRSIHHELSRETDLILGNEEVDLVDLLPDTAADGMTEPTPPRCLTFIRSVGAQQADEPVERLFHDSVVASSSCGCPASISGDPRECPILSIVIECAKARVGRGRSQQHDDDGETATESGARAPPECWPLTRHDTGPCPHGAPSVRCSARMSGG